MIYVIHLDQLLSEDTRSLKVGKIIILLIRFYNVVADKVIRSSGGERFHPIRGTHMSHMWKQISTEKNPHATPEDTRRPEVHLQSMRKNL